MPVFPVSLLLKDKFDSLARADRIDIQTMLLVAERDGIIPAKHSEALAAAIDPALLELIVIEDATHNTIGNAPEYSAALATCLRLDTR